MIYTVQHFTQIDFSLVLLLFITRNTRGSNWNKAEVDILVPVKLCTVHCHCVQCIIIGYDALSLCTVNYHYVRCIIIVYGALSFCASHCHCVQCISIVYDALSLCTLYFCVRCIIILYGALSLCTVYYYCVRCIIARHDLNRCKLQRLSEKFTFSEVSK